jgi:tryptophan 2,3-dioxygenase
VHVIGKGYEAVLPSLISGGTARIKGELRLFAKRNCTNRETLAEKLNSFLRLMEKNSWFALMMNLLRNERARTRLTTLPTAIAARYDRRIGRVMVDLVAAFRLLFAKTPKDWNWPRRNNCAG